ncbi:MAG: radical SAM protein [Actinobacteria bacterium]|nr:radical SAM protein [Actinomycetota bacterium]
MSTISPIYGPVPSRRLGRSLGIDLVPFKTCSYDCIYCQLGRTTCKTLRRRRWLDTSELVGRVWQRLETEPDVVALAGSGEPTLHTGLDRLIGGIKAISDVPVAVVTNGSLLGRRSVQRELAEADIVLPSLDAADPELFRAVNRPHPRLSLAGLVEGIGAFRQAFCGQIWLEVMLIEGVTDDDEEVERLAALAAMLEPDRIQLNTVVRPPAETHVRPMSPGRLQALAAAFRPAAEVIAGAPDGPVDGTLTSAQVLGLISRRSCTAADAAAGLAVHRTVALKALDQLVESGFARRREHEGSWYYSAAASRREEA